MGRISERIKTLKAKYQIMCACRADVNTALKNVQKVYSTEKWVKVPDNQKACIRYYQNTTMPMVSRSFMHIPLYHECKNFNEYKICSVGLNRQCPWYEANKTYVEAKTKLRQAKEDFWNCVWGR